MIYKITNNNAILVTFLDYTIHFTVSGYTFKSTTCHL